MNLYLIRQEHLNILSQIEENEGELSPEIESQLQLTQEEFEKKAVSYGYVIKKLDDDLFQIESEIERLKDLKEKAERKMKRFVDVLSTSMQQFGIEKIETATLKLSFRESEQVVIEDENVIPPFYKEEVINYKISKKKIKDAIKSGELITGAMLIKNKTLQIK